MRRPLLALATAAPLCGIAAAPAAAASMKPKPKAPAGGTVTVTVTNWRDADLIELQAAESGSGSWKKVLGALKAGQWTSPNGQTAAGQELSRRSAGEICGRYIGRRIKRPASESGPSPSPPLLACDRARRIRWRIARWAACVGGRAVRMRRRSRPGVGDSRLARALPEPIPSPFWRLCFFLR